MHPMLNTAVRAARRAGSVIMRQFGHLDRLTIESKGHNDFVTEVDRQAEYEIIQILRQAYPDHAILAEESGGSMEGDWVWIIDPLDGTTNYLHGFPQFAVSIALMFRGRVEQAVVYDPLKDELFTATRGSGVTLNDRRIRVSQVGGMPAALIGTGFPYRSHAHIDAWLATLKDMLLHTNGVRRAGSAALDLAWVACGRLDGFWEFGLSPWDTAAGALLVVEAGGFVTDFSGEAGWLASGNIVAANPRVFPELLRRVQAHGSGGKNPPAAPG